LGCIGSAFLLRRASFFFAGIVVRDFLLFTIVLSRVALAALLLHGVILIRGTRIPSDPTLWASFLDGTIGAFGCGAAWKHPG
jgi:hypothetical protein